MPRTLIAPVWRRIALVVLAFMCHGTTAGQTVWTGFGHSFSKPLFGDPTAAENQDRITDNVWLTRSANQGLYNIRAETGYAQGISPEDTAWATDLIPANAGKAISAENWADLTFDAWVDAYGGPGSNQLPARLTSRNAVVHLISDNIYLDLRFTSWSVAGGSFAYERSLAPIDPPTGPNGDYNQNGEVDAADYVLWRDTLGETVNPPGGGADGNSNGTVDEPDYNFWRSRFGNVVPIPNAASSSVPGAFAASVPEPSLTALLFSASLALRCRGRKAALRT